MKNRIKTTSFWLELSGVIVLLIDAFAGIFNIEIYSGAVQDVILSICAVLISLGFVTKQDINDTQNSTSKELFDEIQDNNKNSFDYIFSFLIWRF